MALMFGAHLSVAGGLVNALARAQQLGMDCVQVFTRNQRQWDPGALRDDEIDAWLMMLREMKWDRPLGPRTPARVVSHNSYLINLASPSASTWRRSIDAHRRELERCERLRIPLCVAHPGAHLTTKRTRDERNRLDGSMSDHEESGLRRIVKALDAIHADLGGYRVKTCVETTVGAGTNLSYSFHHLSFIRSHLREPERVGFCFDTCHVTAAGYDMSSEARAKSVLRAFDQVCGLEHLDVLHMNDSLGGVGSRRDRHTHIGDGACGKACFRTIVNHRKLRRVPKILETPKGRTAKGSEWDILNLRRLKRMKSGAVNRR